MTSRERELTIEVAKLIGEITKDLSQSEALDALSKIISMCATTIGMLNAQGDDK